jgi:hypothetical protein
MNERPTEPPTSPSRGPASHQIVYTIVERPRDQRKVWVRVGAAFRNQDGSTNIYLDAMPTNGQLQIRDPRPADAAPASLRSREGDRLDATARVA